MPWTSSGRITNPTAGQIVADSGALAGGTREPLIAVACSVAVTLELQQRDAANAATLKSQIISVPANTFVAFHVPMGIPVGDGERLRLENVSAVTGVLSVSVFT